MEWQTIETAPKDGKFFLSFDGKDFYVLNEPEGYSIGRWNKYKNSWCGSAQMNFYPTHWMPLPPLPKELKC